MQVKLHNVPDRKFLAAGFAGLITYGLTLGAAAAGLPLPFELAMPLGMAILLAVFYLMPPGLQDVLRRIDAEMRRKFALEELSDPKSTLDPETATRLRDGMQGVVPKIAIAFLLLGGLALGGPVACANYELTKAEAVSPAQRMFALQADYNTALYATVAYLESGYATPEAKRAIARLDQVAFQAITGAADAVRSGDGLAIAVSTATARAALDELVGYLEARKRDGPGGPPGPPAAAGATVPGAGT